MSEENGKRDLKPEELQDLQEELKKLQERISALSGDADTDPDERETVAGPEEALEGMEVETGSEEGGEEEPQVEDRVRSTPRYRRRPYPGGFNFGDRIGDYISSFVQDVMEGVSIEMERSLFQDKHTLRERDHAIDAGEVARIMGSLGNEYRIRILDELSYGGLYASDLQELIQEISPSTLSSHLDVLGEAGLIFQERRRGRYIITIPGRLAVKMAYQIAERTASRVDG
jgi:DNA-binding transcriptional ArsR family regulator